MEKTQKRGQDLPSYDDIFNIVKTNGEDVNAKEIALTELHPFVGHPFKVLDNESMMELVESIKEQGVIIPILARPQKKGGYEIIYGHRRKRACELAGLSTIPTVVKELNDTDAIELMINTNIQREGLFPSEKAFAYALKYKQVSRQGYRADLMEGNVGIKRLQEEEGESVRTIQRYIALTKLLPELLELVDQKKLNFMVGVEIATLSHVYQGYLLEVILEKKVFPKKEDVETLKQYAVKGELTKAVTEVVLEKQKPLVKKINLKQERIQQYFPTNYTTEERENIIYELLEKWHKTQNFTEYESHLDGQICIDEWDEGKYLPK